MGPLILPTGGAVYVDANAIIHSVEPYRSLLAPMWEEARAGRFSLASSKLVTLETLIRPLRDGNARLEMLFRSLMAGLRRLSTSTMIRDNELCRPVASSQLPRVLSF